MTKNVLVTGCAGFIGFNLSKTLLKENHNVYGVDSLNSAYDKKFKELRLQNLESEINFHFTNNDLSNEDSLNELVDIDIVYHMGARAGVRQSFNDPLSYIKDNTIATTNVANFCKKNDISKMILASTSSIYGNSGEKEMVEGIDEKINPPSIYASTKLSGETLAKTILSSQNTNLIITRFFTVYGPYGRPDMALFKFVNSIIKNKKIDLYNYGNHHRDFTYVDDVIDAIIKVTFSKNYATVDPISTLTPIFDGYIETESTEIFIEVKLQRVVNSREQLYSRLSALYHYREAKKVKAYLQLILVELPEDEKMGKIRNTEERFRDIFEPAIEKKLLKIKYVKLTSV